MTRGPEISHEGVLSVDAVCRIRTSLELLLEVARREEPEAMVIFERGLALCDTVDNLRRELDQVRRGQA